MTLLLIYCSVYFLLEGPLSSISIAGCNSLSVAASALVSLPKRIGKALFFSWVDITVDAVLYLSSIILNKSWDSDVDIFEIPKSSILCKSLHNFDYVKTLISVKKYA